jgi:Fe-S-cluster containining protein
MNQIIPIAANGAKVSRSEFGYERTVCACHACIANCRHIPGYLIPADLERMARFLNYWNVVAFAVENLLASSGATVMQAGRIFQIPTLVPRRKEDGSCVFLDEQNRCRIHDVSPYGCAFFDSHQLHAEADRRSLRGLQEIARYWATASHRHAYTIIWRILYRAGLRAVPALVARERMIESLAQAKASETENDAASKSLSRRKREVMSDE